MKWCFGRLTMVFVQWFSSAEALVLGSPRVTHSKKMPQLKREMTSIVASDFSGFVDDMDVFPDVMCRSKSVANAVSGSLGVTSTHVVFMAKDPPARGAPPSNWSYPIANILHARVVCGPSLFGRPGEWRLELMFQEEEPVLASTQGAAAALLRFSDSIAPVAVKPATTKKTILAQDATQNVLRAILSQGFGELF